MDADKKDSHRGHRGRREVKVIIPQRQQGTEKPGDCPQVFGRRLRLMQEGSPRKIDNDLMENQVAVPRFLVSQVSFICDSV